MARTYQALSVEDQEEILVNYLLAQERDHYCHTVNCERFQEMLKTMAADDPFRPRIEQLCAETISRLAEVDAILVQTDPQVKAVNIPVVQARIAAKKVV